MKRTPQIANSIAKTLITFLVLISGAAKADPRPRKPDIVFTEITATRGFWLNGTHTVPVTMKISNIGNRDSGAFYVTASYRRPLTGDEPWVRLSSRGREVLVPALRVGETRVVRALVEGMRAETNPSTITLYADSCAGLEFMPPYCNVDELSEHNNAMLKVVYVE